MRKIQFCSFFKDKHLFASALKKCCFKFWNFPQKYISIRIIVIIIIISISIIIIIIIIIIITTLILYREILFFEAIFTLLKYE